MNDSLPGPAPTILKGYVTVDRRAVHYRTCGEGPDVVLLHDSPRSSRLHLDTMRHLGRAFRVHALDTPGYGNSAPLARPDPTMADFADWLERTLACLGLAAAPIYATHTSAKIALAYAARGAPTPLLLLDGLSIPDQPATEEFIARYLQPFKIDTSGAYLAREWSHVRDMVRWFPWFDRRAETRLAMAPPTAEWMADYLIDLFSAGPHYAGAYAAALRHAPLADLHACQVPTIVAARADDVLFRYLDRVPVDANPTLSVERIAPDRTAWLAWLEQRLGAATRDQPCTERRRPHARSETGPTYVQAPHGQMRLFRAGPQTRVPLLIVEAPTVRHALHWQHVLSDTRATIVPELPGYGESDPLPAATTDAMADLLDAMLDTLGIESADLLGLGLGAGLAITLAARHPSRIRALALDGLPPFDPAKRVGMADKFSPPIAVDLVAGTHLHRLWHRLRDEEIQWPWFDPSPAAARTLPPSIDARALHGALTEILKQPDHDGDAARAILRDRPAYARIAALTLAFTHPTDPAYAASAAIIAALPNAEASERPPSIEETANRLCTFLDTQASISGG